MKLALGDRGKAAALVWGAPLAVEGAAAARSLALAWAIGPDDLGRALMLALTLRLAEMLSDIGIERMLHSAQRRADADIIAALHGASLMRGLAVAGMLILLAGPMAWAFGDGLGLGSYAALALVPLMRGFLHLDYRASEARGTFGPMAIVDMGAALAMLALLPAAVALFGDGRAMLALIWGQAMVQVALSHLVATQAYRIRIDWAVLRQLGRFGLPLVGNAGLMFLALQADRFLVAATYGWAEVAAYAVAFQLASLPAQIAGRAAVSRLSSGLADTGAAGTAAFAAAQRQFMRLGLGFALGYALLAPWAIGWAYGAALQPPAGLALALGAAAGLRIWRTPFGVRAVALGRTGDPARANLWRAAALVPAAGAALLGLPLATLALCAAMGEGAAAWQARHLLKARRLPARKPTPLTV